MEESLQNAYCRLDTDEIRNEKTRLGLAEIEDCVPREGLAREYHRVGVAQSDIEDERIVEQRKVIEGIANRRGIVLRSNPAASGFVITPSDTDRLPRETQSIYVGQAGDVNAVLGSTWLSVPKTGGAVCSGSTAELAA